MTSLEFDRAFRQLYLPLGMYALRIVNDTDTAEDIVEETFLKAWQVVEAGKEIENFKSYMYRSVRNGCLSFLRNQKETVAFDDMPENAKDTIDLSALQDVDEETIDTSVRDARIWKSIDDLTERCREVFLMSKRDGFSNDEIAEELGISVKTVKNQMTKAFSRLRDALSSGHKPFFLPFL
ncbi:MAG: RNA polymerase sigma-70 factor [Muribaculaceae bacterium]|nr:RNA polymerase sigma-70 factor [Muribaculaceae bacterium]